MIIRKIHMQIINYYKDIFQENLKLVVTFLNSAQEKNNTVEKRYAKNKKRQSTS